jgi:aarF domain-containing kinase
MDVRHNIMPIFGKEVVVPAPRLELCSRRCLVMDFLKGPKLGEGVREYARVVAAEQGLTLEQLEAKVCAKWQLDGMPAPYEGPSATQVEAYRTALKWQDWIHNLPRRCSNTILRTEYPYVGTVLPPNAPQIMDTLLRVHGHELLVDGCFNGDPHAGNFLLLPGDPTNRSNE